MAELIWQLLNYLCVGMLYLKDNVILSRNLEMNDFKNEIVGHWGTCPGVNAIYAHLMDYSIKHKESNRIIKLVISTGHSAPSLLSASFLDGTLKKYYPEYNRNEDGIRKLFTAYGNTFSSEIDVRYPGNIYCGGELGAGLAFSQGYIFNHPERIVVCVIGDGEFETPVCQASFQGFQFIDKERDGRVLPVINLNGFKMGGKSTLAEKTDKDIAGYFKFFGLDAVFSDGFHKNIAYAIETCFNVLEAGGFPVLILKTLKGWTAPKKLGTLPFEGTYRSHKPILKNPSHDKHECEEIKAWLESYNIDILFPVGRMNSDVTDFLDSAKESIIDFDRKYPFKQLNTNYIRRFDNNPIACSSLLYGQKDVIIFSPDELDSNGFNSIRDTCRVIELLSEQTCFGWSQGYAAGGGIPLLITYEAFAPLFDSLIDQYLKMINMISLEGYTFPSITIIITSLGWRNVPSHHNPSFTDRLMGYRSPNISIYFPLSPSSVAKRLGECLCTINQLNIIVMDKRSLPVLQKSVPTEESDGLILRNHGIKNGYILFLAIGDIVAEEVLKAYDTLSPNIAKKVKVIGIEMPLAQIKSVKNAINKSIYSVWVYNGRTSYLEALLWEQGFSCNNNFVIGYGGNSNMPSGSARLRENQMDAMSIADLMKRAYDTAEDL